MARATIGRVKLGVRATDNLRALAFAVANLELQRLLDGIKRRVVRAR